MRGALAAMCAETAFDNLVNDAGLALPAPLEGDEAARLDAMTAVNLRAAMLCAQACLPAMRRMGTPREVAALCGFLLSDEAAFFTGQVIHVDGGMSVSHAPL